MIVLMKEHYQDASMHLYPEQQYEVGSVLGEWLVKNKKAVKIESPAPSDRHLNVEPQFEQAETPPVEKPARRSRRQNND